YGYCPGPIYSPDYAGATPFLDVPQVPMVPMVSVTTVPPVTSPAPANDDKNDPIVQGRKLSEWVKELKSWDSQARGKAAAAIGQLGPRAASAVPALIEALKDSDAQVRVEVSVALANIGPAAVPALREALKSENRLTRMGAAFTLGQFGPKASDA